MNRERAWIIVQAGGRGSRLRHHTWNKPKCLVSVRGKPILYHLFSVFPENNFIIIGDYLYDRLSTYLELNPPGVPYLLIKSSEKGTVSGLSAAVTELPENAPVMLVWSDLIIAPPLDIPKDKFPVLFTADSFMCRWTIDSNGSPCEVAGQNNGIPGIFYFPNKTFLRSLPKEGEFLKWFSKNITEFKTSRLTTIEELGDFSRVEDDNARQGYSRFFNRVDLNTEAGYVTKTCVDEEYRSVHENEVCWYEAASKLGFRRIPKVRATNPLVLELINGVHPFEYTELSVRERRAVLADILDTLTLLHDLKNVEAASVAVNRVYLQKTVERVQSIKDLLPIFDREYITINGVKCRNVFHKRHFSILPEITKMLHTSSFVPIHGDPTFSNIIVDDSLRAWFIDPRGSFAEPGIFGDRLYDFAKVYYSAVGGYDFFNRRRFKLFIDNHTVEVLMEPPIFLMEAIGVFRDYFGTDLTKIKLIHGLVWLSLSGYARDDIDSIIGAFALGLYWTELALLEV